MKYYLFISLFFTSIDAISQKSHAEVLNMTKEIKVIDRLYLDITNLERTELDEVTALKLFKRVYGNTGSLPKDTKYYVAGKITKHTDFDLLFLYAEENKNDSAANFNLSLLTTRKDGSYVSMIDGASDNYFVRNNKPQFNKVRSYLYNDFRIKQENELSFIGRKLEMEYRINDYGMIVSYPNYTKN